MAAIVSAPLRWQEVKEIVQRGKSDVTALSSIGRCAWDYADYTEYCSQLKEKWATVGDNMRAKLFNAPTRAIPDGKLEVDNDLDTTSSTCYVLVMKNEFPYSFAPEDQISHVNIWCSSQGLDDSIVEQLIAERLPCDEYVWFVNPPQLRSVKTVCPSFSCPPTSVPVQPAIVLTKIIMFIVALCS
ncbi:hypothetical protein PLESTB_001337800 [Pleodorina starrii]|uniref:Uncharacterized protein n=1 Tax=Pleodorina starrii TaxID=330485 RepID=A0A9W6BUT6_9CHLO|nr:hypothetical protein PLESTB_001337800 [Pleodorina starrii]GLC66402.1 hypothetical protein PLESTF_000423600 [Pleodorina starrii]